MQQGLGWLGWTPKVFWNATLSELYAAIVGKREWDHGIPPKQAGNELESKYGGLLEMVRQAQREEARQERERNR